MELPGVVPPGNPVELPGVPPLENEVNEVVTPLLPSNYDSNNDYDDKDEDTDTSIKQL